MHHTEPEGERFVRPLSLEARQVSVRLAGRPILKDLSATFVSGTSTAIVGPSGAGKTTLLSVLAGTRRPDHGSVLLEGSPVRLGDRITAISQSANGLGNRSAVDNVSIGPLAEGKARKLCVQDAASLLHSLGLEGKERQSFRQLSGGEQQRVAIARALATNAAFVLADEPTGQLDAENTDTVVRSLLNLARERRVGLIIVTHDNDVANKCDVVLSVYGGQLEPWMEP